MKKIVIGCMLVISLFMVSGCQQKKEVMTEECTLWTSLEFYDTTYVTDIYTDDNTSISKLHMTTSYSAKWEDVDVNQLLNTLNEEKEAITTQYENTTYEIHRMGSNVTTEQVVPLTKKNLDILKSDKEYLDAMEDSALSINLYRELLVSKGYQCQNTK